LLMSQTGLASLTEEWKHKGGVTTWMI